MPVDSPKQSVPISTVGPKDKEEIASELFQLVVFQLDKEEYAVPIEDVREVLKISGITPVPNSPDFISGIINLRGKVIAIIDLEKRFNLTREHTDVIPEHIIVSDIEESPFGMIVDQVTEVLRIPRNLVQSALQINQSKIGREYIGGVVVLKSEDVVDKKLKQTSAKAKISKAKKQNTERIQPKRPGKPFSNLERERMLHPRKSRRSSKAIDKKLYF